MNVSTFELLSNRPEDNEEHSVYTIELASVCSLPVIYIVNKSGVDSAGENEMTDYTYEYTIQYNRQPIHRHRIIIVVGSGNSTPS